MDIFGYEITKKIKKKDSGNNVSFVQKTDNDDAILISSGINSFVYSNFALDSDVDDASTIEIYREIAINSDVEWAIDDILNSVISFEPGVEPITPNLEDIKLSDNVKKKIVEEFDTVLRLLDFNNKGDEILRTWYVDGKYIMHKVVDNDKLTDGIKELRYIDPTNIKKILEEQKEVDSSGITLYKKPKEYYVYTDSQNYSSNTAIQVSPESITYAHSGLYDPKKKRIQSYLHKAIKPFNQLQMLEDATVIYRIARAPERRVFYVDVGNLAKGKAEQYLTSVMSNYKNKHIYDQSTGKIKNINHQMSMMEDIWLPRREGSRGTEVSTLPGGQNLGEMDDVLYFKRKLYKALGIPASRIDEENAFGIGRSNEITRDEVKFDKFINKLRKKFSFIFKDILRTQLILRNIITADDWEEYIKDAIKFSYSSEAYFTEMKEAEIHTERMEHLGTIDEYVGKYFSINYVRRNILKQSEDEIKEIDKEIEDEKKEGKIDGDEEE